MDKPYISQVEISNFRNFELLKVFLKPTAVIVGENRVGKSNFVHALRLVLDPFLPDSSRMLRAEDFWDGLEAPFSGSTVEVKVFLQGFEGNKEATGVLADCIVNQNPLTALLTYQFRPHKSIAGGDATEEQYEFAVFGGLKEKYRVGSEIRRWVAMMLLPALRDAESDVQSWKKSPLRPLLERARKLLDKDKLSEVRATIDEATQGVISEPAIQALITNVNDCVRDMVGPIHSMKTVLDFAPSEPIQLLRSMRLFLQESGTRPLSDASLGTTNILFLALLLQDLDERIDAKDLVSAILAIEEPEAHLHPHLQRLLFRHFLSREHSIIVTTHSPNIASVTPIGSLVLLKASEGRTNAYSAKDLKLTDQQLDDLQRYIDVTRAELLFASGVILVEGIAEEFLIPAFAAIYLERNKIARSLDELGISVCSVNGTDFWPYARLLSTDGLGIPHVIITDGDPTTISGSTIYRGLTRGLKLVTDDGARKKIRRTIAKRDYAKARKMLSAEGVFIGETTLEIDIAETLAEEMKQAYSDLSPAKSGHKKFSAAIDACPSPEEAKNVLRRIERLGKGRFGQRLASKITTQKPPAYIAAAIQHIVKAIYRSDD